MKRRAFFGALGGLIAAPVAAELIVVGKQAEQAVQPVLAESEHVAITEPAGFDAPLYFMSC